MNRERAHERCRIRLLSFFAMAIENTEASDDD
jgi:hypothetical protein